jgi:hypothetical protein
MKKQCQIGLVLLIAAGLVSCANEGGLKAGTATAKSMLQLIPADATGVVVINVRKGLGTEPAAKALKDEATKKKYDEFVAKSGIDPVKDIYFLAIGLGENPTAGNQQGAFILNARFNKADVLSKLQGTGGKGLPEDTYEGLTLYKGLEFSKPEKSFSVVGAFLDDSNIVIGTDKGVRKIIDVYHKKADSIGKNAEMGKLFQAVNTSAVAWGAFLIPPDMLKKAVENNPMLKSFEGVTGVTMSFDYANALLVAEIQSLGGTKEQNKQLGDMLGGLKAMGAAAAADNQAAMDLLNAIEITSGDDHVKIYAGLGSELLEKVRKMAQEKAAGLMAFGPSEAKGGKSEEKKAEPEIKK